EGIDPEGEEFVPLDADRAMTPATVLTDHPTGRTYAERVEGYDRYPAIYDDVGLFSFPPVINGRRTEVSVDTRDVLIELTGTDQWTIDKMLAILVYAFDARGGHVESVTVRGPKGDLVRPDLSVRTKTLTADRIEGTLGIDLAPAEIEDLLGRAGLGLEQERTDPSTGTYEVEIPPYRVDVLHPVDLVDDMGRAYGFNQLVARYPDVNTVGARTDASRHEEAVRDLLIGMGFEDLLNFNLTSPDELFDRMDLPRDADAFGAGRPPELFESYSEAFTVLRTWALPSLLQVLENNTHRTYPQHLAEIGFVAEVDESTVTNVAEGRSVAAVLAGPEATYDATKGRLQALASNFGADLSTPRTEHPSFIDGRVATVGIDGEEAGVIGELHPSVLVEHDLEVPVAGFEFDLGALR
ncbi:MAG: phenylalanine--tRNA ligase subunit beta, partial [Halodesulfurarchaeum sp.]